MVFLVRYTFPVYIISLTAVFTSPIYAYHMRYITLWELRIKCDFFNAVNVQFETPICIPTYCHLTIFKVKVFNFYAIVHMSGHLQYVVILKQFGIWTIHTIQHLSTFFRTSTILLSWPGGWQVTSRTIWYLKYVSELNTTAKKIQCFIFIILSWIN